MLLSCITKSYQMSPQNNFLPQPKKLVKQKNLDISLKCLLLDKHESFNQNNTVSWWLKKTCKIPCWNEEDEWKEIDCHGPCKTTLALDDETAENGFFMCKIFPYHTSNYTMLQIEITKTFYLELFGDFYFKFKVS